jgi:hypothetical protein
MVRDEKMATRSTRNNSPNQTRPRTSKGPGTDVVVETAVGLDAPTRTAPDQMTTTVETPVAATMPMLVPPDLRDPDSVTEAAVETVTGTVRSNQHIDAMWSIDQVRNAFALVRGLGWRKLYNGRDGAFGALVALASQARQTGAPITFREEPDGMIYEIYLW